MSLYSLMTITNINVHQNISLLMPMRLYSLMVITNINGYQNLTCLLMTFTECTCLMAIKYINMQCVGIKKPVSFQGPIYNYQTNGHFLMVMVIKLIQEQV